MAVRQRLEVIIKARIRRKMKRDLQRIARDRDLQLSDVLREALHDYLVDERKTQPAEATEQLVNA